MAVSVKKVIVLFAATLVTGVFSGCGGGGSTGAAENAIAKYYSEETGQPVRSVRFVEKPQVYEDSHRSPQDTGTTTKGNVKIEFSNGETVVSCFEVFVADKDGWTNVSDLRPPRHKATSRAEKVKHGLTESRRKQLFYELVGAVDNLDHTNKACRARWQELQEQYGVDQKATAEILKEGFERSWPQPNFEPVGQGRANRRNWIVERVRMGGAGGSGDPLLQD